MILVYVGGHDPKNIRTFLRAFPKSTICIFEANWELAKELTKAFTGFKNVVVLPWALADRDGEGEFWLSVDDYTSSIHGTKFNLVNPKRTRVPYVSASRFISGFDEVVLYLNCEGAEFEIIRDLLDSGVWRKVKVWCIQWHHGFLPEKKREFRNLSRRLRYRGITWTEDFEDLLKVLKRA